MMLGFYAIDESAFRLLESARAARAAHGDVAAAAILIFNGGRPEMTIEEGTARVAVHGSLSPEPGFFSGTSFAEMRAEISQALADNNVERIILDIDSPGGTVAGQFAFTQFLREVRKQKPLTAEISGQATSAAFNIAAQTQKIIALDPASPVGSIGVLTSGFISEDLAFARSAKAPLKGRQLSEPEGQEAVQSLLDDTHAQFVADIVAGFDDPEIDEETVNAKFGRGGVMTARQGLDVGMVNEIRPAQGRGEGVAEAASSSAGTESGASNLRGSPEEGRNSSQSKGSIMDIDTLKAEHPGVYRDVLAQGHTSGVQEERDRVTAHLEMGNASGAMDASAEFIKGGNTLAEASVQSRYMSANMKRTERNDAASESSEELGAPAAPGSEASSEATAEQVTAMANEIAQRVQS